MNVVCDVDVRAHKAVIFVSTLMLYERQDTLTPISTAIPPKMQAIMSPRLKPSPISMDFVRMPKAGWKRIKPRKNPKNPKIPIPSDLKDLTSVCISLVKCAHSLLERSTNAGLAMLGFHLRPVHGHGSHVHGSALSMTSTTEPGGAPGSE